MAGDARDELSLYRSTGGAQLDHRNFTPLALYNTEQQLAAGAIQLVTTTMPEAKTMVDAGQIRTIAIMSAARDPAYPNVPTVKEAVNVDWALGAWRGIAGPRNLPEAIATRARDALRKVVADPEFVRLMRSRSFGIEYADGPAFATFLETADKRFGDAARAAGLAR